MIQIQSLKRRRELFNEIINTDSLLNYYNITDDKLEIKVNHELNMDSLLIKYKLSCNKIDIKYLPEEINKIINSYLSDDINIKIKIKYLDNYPYHAPIWRLEEIEHNINLNIHLNLEDYMEYLIDNHNYGYSKNYWSCGLNIQTDILNFLVKFNSIKYIEEYINNEVVII